jgi:hypothetical protein
MKQLLLVTLLCCAGCTSHDPVQYTVQGKVTWNGQPLAVGYIDFESVDGKSASGGGKIVNGVYEAKASAGKNRVKISASRPVGTAVDAQMGAVPQEQYIPEIYNNASTLAAEIQPNHNNSASFELVDQPKP